MDLSLFCAFGSKLDFPETLGEEQSTFDKGAVMAATAETLAPSVVAVVAKSIICRYE
jgi:hypothetical protein